MSRRVKPLETESKLVVSRGWSWGGGRNDPYMDTGFSLGMMEMFWNWREMAIAQLCEYTKCH